MDIELKNILLFLNSYTDELIGDLKQELLRSRSRDYGSRTLNTPINASGEGSGSLEKTSDGNEINVKGNAYLEKVDEGTKSTSASLQDIMKWINVKPVLIKDRKGNLVEQTKARKEAFAKRVVARLKESGLRRTNFITDTVNNSDSRLNGIENAAVDDVLANIDKILESHGISMKNGQYTIQK